MVRLQRWQWAVLAGPIALVILFLLVAAGLQIHSWGLSWIWPVIGVLFVGWRWLLVKWTKPALDQARQAVADVTEELEAAIAQDTQSSTQTSDVAERSQAAILKILEASRNDPLPWDDSLLFWNRCLDLVSEIAQAHYPSVKRPLLNIYIPQAYALIRGTVDDMDQWMQKLGPALSQVSIGQAYEAYEVYRKLEPSARKVLKAWGWAQWVLNPAAAIARRATQRYSSEANQQLVVNFGQLLRETVLRNLGRQAIALYSGMAAPLELPTPAAPTLPATQTQTLREILNEPTAIETVIEKPVNLLLVGRTGAGKSSLINTLFVDDRAAVDVLPSTDRLTEYQWNTQTGDALTLWDTPGYEQAARTDLREQVLAHLPQADLVLLVLPALDPALQMDLDFLDAVQRSVPQLPVIVVMTQVDRLRPIREWTPPYDWEFGDRPKELAIREATQYRIEQFGDRVSVVLPMVTGSQTPPRSPWGVDSLSLALIRTIGPAKQGRLGRFLKDLDARTVAAAAVIDRYTLQMSTTQGLTALLKSPILKYLSILTTGSTSFGDILAAKIPVEQVPIVVGKLQMAYELSNLVRNGAPIDLLSLWPMIRESHTAPDREAWAFGHAIVEYWTRNLTVEQFRQTLERYRA